jgi:nicotinic acid mononucleotide adenylyltransferase
MLLDDISVIEWKAQHLVYNYKSQGPLIQLINEEISTDNTNLLVIQGSFDPPLISHEELIHEAINICRKSFSRKNMVLLLLFSLSHVEKEIDIQKNSLLGYRVLMVKELLSSISNEEGIPFMIGISNVGRYIELTSGIKRKFPTSSSINYVMGTDVFIKIFDPRFYEKQLTEILSEIFRSNYIVAGRGETGSVEDFDSFLTSLKIPSKFLSQISFINISDKLRYESSTNIRNQLSLNRNSKIASVPHYITSFLKENHLYSKVPEIIIPEFIVQTTTKFAIDIGLGQEECLKFIQKLITEFKEEKEFRNRVMKEFHNEEYKTLKDRIQEWLKSNF